MPIGKYLGFSIVAWGTVLACTAACTDFAGLVTVRTLLGLFESACQPAFVLLSSIWYRREEQASRVTYWYMMNGMQQIVGGMLAYCFTLITTGPLKSWQWLFLAYGVVSVIFGFFVGWYMPDSPMRAKCFSEEDKHLMVERVRDNQTGVQNKEFKKPQLMEALGDPQVWGYAIIALCTTLPTSGLGSFYNIVIKSLGFTTLQTQLLAMVLGAYIIVILLSSMWLVQKTGQNLLVMLVFLIPYVDMPPSHMNEPIAHQKLTSSGLEQGLYRYDLPDDRAHGHTRSTRWPHDQLLHHLLLLECADLGPVHDLAKCGRPNQEVGRHRHQLYCLGDGERHRPTSVSGQGRSSLLHRICCPPRLLLAARLRHCPPPLVPRRAEQEAGPARGRGCPRGTRRGFCPRF